MNTYKWSNIIFPSKQCRQTIFQAFYSFAYNVQTYTGYTELGWVGLEWLCVWGWSLWLWVGVCPWGVGWVPGYSRRLELRGGQSGGERAPPLHHPLQSLDPALLLQPVQHLDAVPAHLLPVRPPLERVTVENTAVRKLLSYIWLHQSFGAFVLAQY